MFVKEWLLPHNHSPVWKRGFCLAFFLWVGCFFTNAQVYIIETRNGGQNVSDFSIVAGTWFPSSGKSPAPGTTPTREGSYFPNGTSGPAKCLLTPTLPRAGAMYRIDITVPITDSIPCDLLVDIAVTNATGTKTDGMTFSNTPVTITNFALCTNTFSHTRQTNWNEIATIALDPGVTSPTIALSYSSGNSAAPGFARRWYMDAIRFTEVGNPCLDIPEITVQGPLAQGQDFVEVAGVSNTATAITVYGDGVIIGQRTNGVVGGINRVTVTALVKGQKIVATQTINEIEGCIPLSGPTTGGGPNNSVRVNLLLGHDNTLSGPIGTSAPTNNYNGNVYCLGSASPVRGGFGNAPEGGFTASPNTCWQTTSFHFSIDPSYPVNALSGNNGNFAFLDGIAFCMDASILDSGPYKIYIDNIVNGSTLIEDFEAATHGTSDYLFKNPTFSGTTSSMLLASPNTAAATTNLADTGKGSAVVDWQWKGESDTFWLRLVTQGTNGPVRRPQVDLNQPISVRILVLPAEQTNTSFQISQIGRRTNAINDNVNLSVSVLKGVGPFTYQWKSNSVDIPGATSSSLSLTGVQTNFSANYSCVVTGDACSSESFGLLEVTEHIPPPRITYTVDSAGQVTLHWSGSGFTLESTTSLSTFPVEWTTIPEATDGYSVDVSPGTKFFRLKR